MEHPLKRLSPVRQRAFGPDRLHRGPIAELPPVAQQWRRLNRRLMALRRRLKQQPTPAQRRDIKRLGQELHQQLLALEPAMREIGFRIHPRKKQRWDESRHETSRRLLEGRHRTCVPNQPLLTPEQEAALEAANIFLGDYFRDPEKFEEGAEDDHFPLLDRLRQEMNDET